MISEKDILRAANVLIEHAGSRALSRARARVHELWGEGDIEVAKMWERIVKAIEELQKPK